MAEQPPIIKGNFVQAGSAGPEGRPMHASVDAQGNRINYPTYVDPKTGAITNSYGSPSHHAPSREAPTPPKEGLFRRLGRIVAGRSGTPRPEPTPRVPVTPPPAVHNEAIPNNGYTVHTVGNVTNMISAGAEVEQMGDVQGSVNMNTTKAQTVQAGDIRGDVRF